MLVSYERKKTWLWNAMYNTMAGERVQGKRLAVSLRLRSVEVFQRLYHLYMN